MRFFSVSSLLAIAVTLCTAQANAQLNSSTMRINFGFDQTAANLAGEYESKQSDLHGMGGYIFIQTEKKESGVVTVPQITALGGYMPVHLTNRSQLDVYVAPGAGIAMVKVGTSTETAVGPSLKMGVDYHTSSTLSWGLQYSTYFNWLNSKAGSGYEVSQATVKFAL